MFFIFLVVVHQSTEKLIFFFFPSVYDLAFKPDGSQLIVAAGHRVLVSLSSFLWPLNAYICGKYFITFDLFYQFFL